MPRTVALPRHLRRSGFFTESKGRVIMINILFCGINGRMGKVTYDLTVSGEENSSRYKIIAGVDITGSLWNYPFPVYKTIEECADKPDVIIDFSHHSALPSILGYALNNFVPAVICTTGHSEDELALMKEASERIPVFFSRNMSLGINLLMKLTKEAAAMLGEDFDIEIVEAHHHNKLDAPSGTALMLADSAKSGRGGDMEYTYDRHSVRKKREKSEIGIHSIRGGNIVGEHSVIFAGDNEVITLSHSAADRGVFASGALKAASFIVGKPAGLYNMDNVISEII